MALSTRGYDRVRKVARTIADLAGADNVGGDHVAEALQFRMPFVTTAKHTVCSPGAVCPDRLASSRAESTGRWTGAGFLFPKLPAPRIIRSQQSCSDPSFHR